MSFHGHLRSAANMRYERGGRGRGNDASCVFLFFRYCDGAKNILLVSQLLDDRGVLFTYEQFMQAFSFQSPRENMPLVWCNS